jgi:flagellar biosynthesis GTPase FlhF
MNNMIKCKNCGAEIAAFATMCPKCGVKLKIKKPIYKKWWFWVIVVFVVFGAIGSTANKDKSASTKVEDTANQTDDSAKADTTTKEEANTTTKNEEATKVEKEEKKEESVPTEYKTALKKAEVYSETMNMSKRGLYEQLTSEAGEKFKAEAAQYAIDNLQADYKKNALKKAQVYQETMAMSPSAIYDQLISEAGEKFTAEEAQYAIDNLK